MLLLGVEGVMKAMVGLVRLATIAIRENLMMFADIVLERKCIGELVLLLTSTYIENSVVIVH